MSKLHQTRIVCLLWLLAVIPAAYAIVLNNPYPASDALKKIYYSSFSEQPKTLDPARSYSSNEYQFISQIYEPVLQYDYYKRPYELIPLSASSMPQVRYLDKFSHEVKKTDSESIAYSVYTIHLKKGIFYQPHPAFAKNDQGDYLYLDLPVDYLDDENINQLSDFKKTGTREMVADDFLYQIKRLASPEVGSSIYGLMSEHIVGFREFASLLPGQNGPGYLDLRQYPMAGLNKIDDYTFEIKLTGLYPQFNYWLAMPFFAPVPWEVDKFYSQADMDDKNLSFDWYPVGTGPFMLTENNPNRRMVMQKNPNYHYETFPLTTDQSDIDAGYAHHMGQVIPLIDEAIYTLEKESIPRWNKFLQGYYDISGISTDSFDQAIQIASSGDVELSSSMLAKRIHLTQTTDPSVYYLGFNMLDPVVGGKSERARKLRLAISMAVNFDENIAIFFNGRGQAAHGPIPPGIFGYKEGESGINTYVYQWRGKAVRRSIDEARQLMAEAGYKDGRDPKTGAALILHYDVPIAGGPDDKSQLDWMRKQFAKIGIDLNIRGTQYNRFQEKMRNGNAQIYSWGWNADYPDPENFLFMLYGANGKVKFGGENASNYNNPAYDKLFDLMKNRDNDSQRQALIDQMVTILRHDAPWVWGINTQTFTLAQQWVSLTKPNTISLGSLKYIGIDVMTRNELRQQWNQAILWPIGVLFLLFLLLLLPLLYTWYRKERSPASRNLS